MKRSSLAVWIGMMVFFAGVIAPTVFRVLPRELAIALQNAVFPKYFMIGAVCGGVYFLATLIHGRRRASHSLLGWKLVLPLLLSAVGTLVFLYCGWSLTPQIQQLASTSATDPNAASALKTLHSLSVQLNGGVLLALLLLLILDFDH
jgi:hypothetical protein